MSRQLRISPHLAARLLKPVIRVLLRCSIQFRDLIEVLKSVVIEITREELLLRSERATSGRISALSGLHRKDVARLLDTPAPQFLEKPGVFSRIINRWSHGKRWCNESGNPRALTCKGPRSEFSRLVRQETVDLYPTAVLAGLERMGAVRRVKDSLELLTLEVSSSEDMEAGWVMLAADLESLTASVAENLSAPAQSRNVHFRTEFDNLYLDAVPELRDWIIAEAQAFHRRVRERLSVDDKDLSPRGTAVPAGGSITLGTFGLIAERPNRLAEGESKTPTTETKSAEEKP
jgi:hypothetical protein